MIKCIVWDLDDTIWEGNVFEGKRNLKKKFKETIIELDKRGILHSIASKNKIEIVKKELDSHGIYDFFLYPQVDFYAKSSSIKAIKESLGISYDSMLFIDDQQYEIDEVLSVYPEVKTMNSKDINDYSFLLDLEELKTSTNINRRTMYLDDIKRKKYEKEFIGPREDFLKSLNMVFKIHRSRIEEIDRIIELLDRTNKFNTSGLKFNEKQLEYVINSDFWIPVTYELYDIYGSYGLIGFSLTERHFSEHICRVLAMSCRIYGRCVSNIPVNYVCNNARDEAKSLIFEFEKTKNNEQMELILRRKSMFKSECGYAYNGLCALGDKMKNYPDFITVYYE